MGDHGADEAVASYHQFRRLFPERVLAMCLLSVGASEGLDDGERLGDVLEARFRGKTGCPAEQISNSNGDGFEEVV